MRVLLADDHALVRAGIRALLVGAARGRERDRGGRRPAGARAAAGDAAGRGARSTSGCPGSTASSWRRASAREAPGTRLVIVSMHGTPAHVAQALAGGRQRLPAQGRRRGRAAGAAARGDARRDLSVAGHLEAGGRAGTSAGRRPPRHRRRGGGDARGADLAPARDPAARRRGEVDQGDRPAARPQREDGRDAPGADHGPARESATSPGWFATRSGPGSSRPTGSGVAARVRAPRLGDSSPGSQGKVTDGPALARPGRVLAP